MPSGISASPSQNVYMTPQHPLWPRQGNRSST